MRAAVDPHAGAGEEPAQLERVQIEVGRPRVAGVQDLEAAVDEEAVDPVGRQPAPDVAGGLEHVDVAARGGQPGGRRQTGQARTDHHDLCARGHRHRPNVTSGAAGHLWTTGSAPDRICLRSRHACRRTGRRAARRPRVHPRGAARPRWHGRGVARGAPARRPAGRGQGAGRRRAAAAGAGGRAARRARPPAPGPAGRGRAPAAPRRGDPRRARARPAGGRQPRPRCWRAAGGCARARWSRRARRSPRRWPTRTPTASSTATCRRATSSSPPRAGRCSPTSVSARVLGETAAAEVTPAYVDPTVARGGAPGSGLRRLRRRRRGLPRAHRDRAVERRHPGRHAGRGGARPPARPRRAGPRRPAGAARGHRPRAVGRSARPRVGRRLRARPAARLPPRAGAALTAGRALPARARPADRADPPVPGAAPRPAPVVVAAARPAGPVARRRWPAARPRCRSASWPGRRRRSWSAGAHRRGSRVRWGSGADAGHARWRRPPRRRRLRPRPAPPARRSAPAAGGARHRGGLARRGRPGCTAMRAAGVRDRVGRSCSPASAPRQPAAGRRRRRTPGPGRGGGAAARLRARRWRTSRWSSPDAGPGRAAARRPLGRLRRRRRRPAGRAGLRTEPARRHARRERSAWCWSAPARGGGSRARSGWAEASRRSVAAEGRPQRRLEVGVGEARSRTPAGRRAAPAGRR